VNVKIGFMGCRSSSIDFFRFWKHNMPYNLDAFISIPSNVAYRNNVITDFYKNALDYSTKIKYIRDIPFYLLETYNMSSEKDKSTLLKLGLDIIIVLDWQRLLPNWLLDSLSIGAFGVHSPSKLLPYGRGRSPINWSLIEGKSSLFVHLIKYSSGIDNGNIIDYSVVKISPQDNCHTLYLKQTYLFCKMLKDNLPKLLKGDFIGTPQGNDKAMYYHKRTPEDGLINWQDSTEDIYNFIRAQTIPFPGAYTYLDSKKITVWEAIPFNIVSKTIPVVPGRIENVFHDNSVMVCTIDGSLLLTIYNYSYVFSNDNSIIGKVFK